MSQHSMLSLQMNNYDDTSDEESSNGESNELEEDAGNRPLVEDVIEGDKDDSTPEPTGRDHRVQIKFK